MRKLSSRARWAVPAGAVAVVGIVVAVTTVASASEPSLPPRTPAQLLTEVLQPAARPLSPQTATIQETSNFGIPALPQIGATSGQSGPESSLNLLAGTTTVDLWYLNPAHVRIAVPTQMGESDLRLDGNRLWLWDSRTQTATHVLLPAKASLPGRKAGAQVPPGVNTGSPATFADGLLKALSPTSRVTVGANATVAGRSAYQLVIAPKTPGSLIGQIVIAIDATSHLPLRVQVFARGSSSPAFQLGYTALSFGAPAASNFTFTPPPGAKVKTQTVPDKAPAGFSPAFLGTAGLGSVGGSPAVSTPMVSTGPQRAAASNTITVTGGSGNSGSTYTFVAPGAPPLPPATARQARAAFVAHLPKSMTKAQRAALIRAFDAQIAGRETGSHSWTAPMTAQPPLGIATAGGPRVLGSAWTSVVATPANPAVAAAVQQLLTGQAAGSQISTNDAGSGSPSPPIAVGPDLAVVRALLRASTPVSGSWGSGRLLRTALLTVLVTSKGQILAGAVTPSVLYGDVAALSR